MQTENQMTAAYAELTAKTGDKSGKKVYSIHTLGCQMNVHDSERIAGLLQEVGYVKATKEQADALEADVVVLNTCAVRENATERMYGTIGLWRKYKQNHPGMQIAVGGCMAQKDRERIAKKAPWVDVVFGTKNIQDLPRLLEEARIKKSPQVQVGTDLTVFPSELPVVRAGRVSAWVAVSVGCNNTCTFCIVPSVRGRERDRRAEDILDEVRKCADSGVKEVTLLGQNVNSYGYASSDRYAFSKLLRACGKIDGLERVRFTSPHPAAFTDDVIEAMAETENVMHQLHMPLQSGSDKILRAMRRSYRVARFNSIIEKVRKAMPDAQISTDIITGFPGETEEDFQATLDVVKSIRFSSAYTFEYSPRPGTPAALMEQIDRDIVRDRYLRLTKLQDAITEEELAKFKGRDVEVLVTGQGGRKDEKTHRVTGRERGGVLVHVSVPEGQKIPQIGDFVTATVTDPKPHYLVSDPDISAGHAYSVRS